MDTEQVLGHQKSSMENPSKEKKTRRKRRIPGTDKPPRKSFSLRLEVSMVTRIDKMLKAFNGSRNEYIEQLIEHDLGFRERLQPLNTQVPAYEE